MGFITRYCTNPASLCALLLAAACATETSDHGFQIRNVALRPEARRLNVRFTQDLQLSAAVIDALEHGVPLTISILMELRNQETLTLLADDEARYEIRYLPLSQHYELIEVPAGNTRTFPRLRHAVNALSSLDLGIATGPLAPGAYEFRARTRLDRTSLPAPMQLPVQFSGDWRHDSDWSSWSFKISA